MLPPADVYYYLTTCPPKNSRKAEGCFVKIIQKTPYARIAYLRTRECLAANIAVFRRLRKRLINSRLISCCVFGA